MRWRNSAIASWYVGLLAVVALMCVPQAHAQEAGAAAHVDWRATADPATVAPGDRFDILLRADIDPGWKMYAMDSPPPTRGVKVHFEAHPELAARAGDVEQSTPVEAYDPNFDMNVRLFKETARFRAPFTVDQRASPGSHAIKGSVDYMVCNARLCLPPTTQHFVAAVRVGAASAGVAAPEVPERSPEDSTRAGARAAPTGMPEVQPLDVQPQRQAGREDGGPLWAFLLLAAGAGLAALLTPCVFPMIPLTVSYFTRHAREQSSSGGNAGGSRQAAVRMALVYGGTIILTFTGLGVAAAAILGAAGAQSIAADPWVNLLIGGVFIVFALSLLGLFELRLPNSWVNYFNRRSTGRGGYAGVFFMGLTLTLVSFSCTAPFVGGLLAATTQGAWAYPIVGMLVFSAVFALPFVGFALFPHGLEALPRSGGWMRAVTVTLGFVELAAALKFLSNADLVWGWGLLSRPLVIALTSVIFLMAGLYLLGLLRLEDESSSRTSAGVPAIGVGRLLAAMGFIGLSLYLLPGLFGAPLGNLDAYLPPREAETRQVFAGIAPERLQWHEDIEVAFASARAAGKPLFIDFTGYTCTNCREMEANVFPKPAVRAQLEEDFVLLRLYTDDAQKGPALQQFQLSLVGTVALPTYAIVAPDDRRVLAQWSGMASVEEFAAFLTRGRSATPSATVQSAEAALGA